MLNRMYLNVQETTFRTIQILFHCGFLHQKKTQEPNDGHSRHKNKQRGRLGVGFLPLLFSPRLVMCDIVFLCGCISCTNMLVGWHGRARTQGSSYLLPQISLPSWQVSSLAALEKCSCFLAQGLPFLGAATRPPPLNDDLVSTVECVIGKRRWPELK